VSSEEDSLWELVDSITETKTDIYPVYVFIFMQLQKSGYDWIYRSDYLRSLRQLVFDEETEHLKFL